MIKHTILTALIAFGLAAPAAMAESEGEIHDTNFSFEGPFGTYDTLQLQRGLYVFTEVCAACHGLQYVAFRTLADEGGPQLPEDQAKAYAALYEAANTADDDGELGELRPATLTDHFPQGTFEGAPDLSLMAKARAGFHGPAGTGINQLLFGLGGPEYIASVLTGYLDEPACAPTGADAMDGYYNTAFTAGGYPESCKIFEETVTMVAHDDGTTSELVERIEVGRMAPGSWIAMPPQLEDGLLDFEDGHANDVHHIAADVSAFLMWTAEPHLNARKQTGFTAFMVLMLLAVMLYLTNKALWAKVKRKD